MEENNFNNNPINNELPQQPVEPVTQNVQQPIVEPVQPVTPELQQPVEPLATVQPEPTVQPVVEPQMPVNNAPVPEKKNGGNKVLMAILVLIALIAVVAGILFATGKLDFGKKEGNVEEPKTSELNYKTVNNVNLTKSSSTKFNGMTVEITQLDNPTGPATSSVKINGTEINDKVNIGGIYSYTIYYGYVVFFSVNSTSTQLSIYNPKDGSVESYTPKNSFGYRINSYYISDNKIIMNGVNAAAQYGMADPGYSNAELEIAYANNKLGGIGIIKKYNIYDTGVTEEVTNSSVSYKTVNNIKGNSTMTYNNITVAVVQESYPAGYSATSVKVNGTEIKDKVTAGGIYSYTIYNTYVIFLSANNIGKQLVIYNTKDGSAKDYTPADLAYMATDYEIGENKIIVKGVNASEQFGLKDTGYKNADIEIVYSNGTFSNPKVVKEYNKKAVWKDVNSVVGNSRTIFNDVDVNIQQNPETSEKVCSVNSITVNGKEVKDKLSNLCVYSYTIVDNYVLFLIAGTSIPELRVYDTKTDSITDKYIPSALEGYAVKDYSFVGDSLIITGRNAGEQFGIQNSGKPYAQFTISYSDGKFGTITKVWERDSE